MYTLNSTVHTRSADVAYHNHCNYVQDLCLENLYTLCCQINMSFWLKTLLA